MRHVSAVWVVVAVWCMVAVPAGLLGAPAAEKPLPPRSGESPAKPPGSGESPAKPAPPPRPEVPACVALSAKVLTPSVLPCEPVILELTWRNTSTEAVEYPDDQPLLLAVQKGDDKDAARYLWLARRIQRDLMIPLKAGESVTRKIPLVLGWPPSNAKPPIEFILPEPGRYAIAIKGTADPAPFAVTVLELTSAEDRAAKPLWTTDLARGLVGPALELEAVGPATEALYSEAPTSRYAAYALWVWCTDLTSHRGRPAFLEAARWGEALLARHPDFPLRKESFKALVAVYTTLNRADEAHALQAELERELREGSPGSIPPPAALPGGPSVARAGIRAAGTELIPAGAREAFEAFWNAVALGNFAALDPILARDFMSDDGPRRNYGPTLSRLRRNARAGAVIQLAVTGAQMAKTYTRPRSLPAGAARTWYGPLCVVEGRVALPWDQNGGRFAASEPQKACWVFYEYPKGKWQLVSETSVTRNRRAGAGAQDIFAGLPRTIRTWRISDGARERSPYEDIKAKLGLTGKVVDERAEWVNHKLVMVGPTREEPSLLGEVRLLLKTPAGTPEQWVQRDVTFFLAIGPRDGLIFKRFELRPPSHGPRPSGPDPAGR